MDSKPIIPRVGTTYKNRNGFSYRCIDASANDSTFISSVGWMFHVRAVRRFNDGSIEWSHSYGGRFVHDYIRV